MIGRNRNIFLQLQWGKQRKPTSKKDRLLALSPGLFKRCGPSRVPFLYTSASFFFLSAARLLLPPFTEPVRAVPKWRFQPQSSVSSLCGRLDQCSKSKFPPNLIGAACIRCLPLVQSSVAWRVGLCVMWKQECGWSQKDFSRTSRKRCCAGESRSGFKHLFMQPLPDLWPSVSYVISLGLSVFIW